LLSVAKNRTLIEKLQVHLTLAIECLHLFQTNSLDGLIGLEQEIATGYNSEGAAVKDLHTKVARYLSTTELTQENKMRLVLLFFATKIRTQAEYDKVVDSANLSEGEKQILEEFMSLKSSNTREVQSRKPFHSEYEFNLSRYFPAIRDILSELFRGELNDSQFPFLRPEEKSFVSFSKVQKRRKITKNSEDHKFREPKKQARGMPVFVFILGGICHSEIREIYISGETNNTDIFIGSTNIITPEIFLSNIRSNILIED